MIYILLKVLDSMLQGYMQAIFTNKDLIISLKTQLLLSPHLADRYFEYNFGLWLVHNEKNYSVFY